MYCCTAITRYISSYEYLGITFQTQLTFTDHIGVIASLKNLSLVSVDTAMRIFNMKILPVVTYLDVFSTYLTCRLMLELIR